MGGSAGNTGRLVFQTPSGRTLAGETEIPRWTWTHVALVRDGETVQVFLNGKQEISGNAGETTIDQMWLGGRSDGRFNWEGRLDEAAVFDRALTPAEVAQLSKISP